MTAIVKKDGGALAPATPTAAWGTEGLDKSDVLLPRILLAQALSKAVGDKKVENGDLYRSTSLEVLAKAEKTKLSFVIVSSFKSWRISEKGRQQFEYRRREPMKEGDAGLPLEWQDKTSDGRATTEWRRDREINFYVLLVSDIERETAAFKKLDESGELPSPDDALLPCVLSFTRSSYMAGKALSTHVAKAAHFNRPPASWVFSVMTKATKNDQGNNYFVMEVGTKTERVSTPVELAAALKWHNSLFAGGVAVKIDDDEEPIEAPAPVRGPDAAYQAEVNRTF